MTSLSVKVRLIGFSFHGIFEPEFYILYNKPLQQQ